MIWWVLLHLALGSWAFHTDLDPLSLPLLVFYLTLMTLALWYSLWAFGFGYTRAKKQGQDLTRYRIPAYALLGCILGAGFAWLTGMAGAILAIIFLGATT